jgi:hypothetical protein
VITKLVATLAIALFGLLVNSSAAGALVAYASSGSGLCGFGGKCEFAVQEDCPPPAKSDWCSSDGPLKEEVPGLGDRNIH